MLLRRISRASSIWRGYAKHFTADEHSYKKQKEAKAFLYIRLCLDWWYKVEWSRTTLHSFKNYTINPNISLKNTWLKVVSDILCVCVKSNSRANMGKLSYSRKCLQMHEDTYHDFSGKLVIEPMLTLVNLQPVLGNYAFCYHSTYTRKKIWNGTHTYSSE